MSAPSSTKARSYLLWFSIFGKAGDVAVCLQVVSLFSLTSKRSWITI